MSKSVSNQITRVGNTLAYLVPFLGLEEASTFSGLFPIFETQSCANKCSHFENDRRQQLQSKEQPSTSVYVYAFKKEYTFAPRITSMTL